MRPGDSVTRPLRICLLSQEFPPHTAWGGIATYTAAMAEAYTAAGHDVTVITRRTPRAAASERIGGIQIFRVGAPIGRKRLTGRTLDRILHARAVFRRVAELDRDRPFDVIETPEAAFDGARLARHPAFAGRLVVQCHGSNANGEPGTGLLAPLHALDWKWSLRHEHRLLTRAAAVMVPSEAMAARLEAIHRVQRSHLDVIPHGLDLQRFSPADARPPRPLTIGFVARLEARKGVDALWHAIDRAQELGSPVFRIRGALHPATAAASARRLAASGASVEYQATQPHETMPAFYRSLDVLLQPSRFESFGLAYAEAMASGVVVIAGRGGAGPEIVTDGHDGFIVEDADFERIAVIIRRLAAEPGLRERLAFAARRTALARFSLERCVERKMNVFARLDRARG